MQEIVEQVLEGRFCMESGSLEFSCAKIELETTAGRELSGSFILYGDEHLHTEGEILSTDYRMECLTPVFSGAESEISYYFHGDALEEGETVKGAFRILSNQGEYSLPFSVTCIPDTLQSSMGPVRNMFHFTNLAKSNWQEALELFYSAGFERVFQGSETAFLQTYRGLSAYPGQEQNMEEFLISIGKKQRVDFLLEQSRLQVELSSAQGEYQPLEQELIVTRNGWGYTALNVECDGDFLFTEKTLLTEDDFLGNYTRLPVYVDQERLRSGMNYGKVVFFNSYVNLEVEVQVKLGVGHDLNQAYLARKKTIVSLMTQYEAFRTKKTTLASWLAETGDLVETLIAYDEKDPAARLFKAQLLITQERTNEANWLLEHAKDLMERKGSVPDELWAYYLYLTTLVTRDEEQIHTVAGQVEGLYRRNPGSWRIAWLLLYLSEEYSIMPKARLQLMERQYGYGCRSFVMYLEALQVYNSHPLLLQKLGAFEQQILFYGIRREYINPELGERFLELLERNKEYSPLLCRILEKFYEKRPDNRIVKEMCSLLVKGGCIGSRYLPWYERGVEAQLRINHLYESFMMSLDPENRKGIPKAAVLYFSYQNNLDYERSAFLYEYVLDNKVLYAEVYDKYYAKCREFCLEQIRKERINRHLAKLYTRLLDEEMITEQNAGILSRILFATRICVEDKRMKKALLYTEGSMLPREYPLIGGETWAPVYGNDTEVFFEDAYGNRFSHEIPHELEKYMLPGKYLPELMKYEFDCPEFDLYLLRERGEGDVLDEDMTMRAVRLLDWKYTAPDFRRSLYLKLVRQFYETDQSARLSELLGRTEEFSLDLEERKQVLKYLVLSGAYDTAFDWIRVYGPYFPEANTLARLMGYVMMEEDLREDPAVLSAVTYLFHRGKCTDSMMEYLGTHARGTTKELRDIWKALLQSGLDTTVLEEHILIQILYTGAYIGEKQAVFEAYLIKNKASRVVEAYILQGAYDYFVRDKVVESIIFESIMESFRWNQPLHKVCKLAFLKYYAENPKEITQEINQALGQFLEEMLAERIHFGFFKKLKGQSHRLRELEDKVIVEYRTRPGGTARIHYVVLEEDGAAGEYLSETMGEVFGGICTKEFVLFFGETLQYYIMEEFGGREQLTESGNLQCEDMDAEAPVSKYHMINEMVISRNLQDYDTLDSDLETYYFKEFCGSNLFTLK